MDIKTRKQAMMAGESTYYTGKPCINGHLSYRYTAAGSCNLCVNGNKISKMSYENHIEESKNFRVLHDLPLIRIRLFSAEVNYIMNVSYALAIARHPTALIDDMKSKAAVMGKEPAGTALYPFYCHTDDESMLRQAAAETFKKYAPDVAAIRAHAFGAAGNYLPPDSTPDVDFS